MVCLAGSTSFITFYSKTAGLGSNISQEFIFSVNIITETVKFELLLKLISSNFKTESKLQIEDQRHSR